MAATASAFYVGEKWSPETTPHRVSKDPDANLLRTAQLPVIIPGLVSLGWKPKTLVLERRSQPPCKLAGRKNLLLSWLFPVECPATPFPFLQDTAPRRG